MEEALRLAPADAELAEACAQLENLLGRHADAARRLVEALRWAPDGARERLARVLARTRLQLGDAAAVLDTADALLSGTAGATRAATEALLLCARLLLGEPAGDCRRRILEPLAAASGEQLTDALGAVVWAPLALRLAEADEDATTARLHALATRAGFEQLATLLAAARAWHLLDRFELAAALEQLDAADDYARLSGAADARHLMLSLGALARELAGDVAGARRAAEELVVDRPLLVRRPEPADRPDRRCTGRPRAAARRDRRRRARTRRPERRRAGRAAASSVPRWRRGGRTRAGRRRAAPVELPLAPPGC